MDSLEKYEYWLDIAQYDLNVAESMLKDGHWLYVVFMCQQAVEKLVKGLYTLYISENVPRVHNIRLLVENFEDKLTVPIPSDKYIFFDTLSAFYMNNRYPDFMTKLSAQIHETEAKKILSQTKEAFSWLLTLKP
jgi:HEPN domain-containing protein